MTVDPRVSEKTEELPLSKAAELLLGECRMVLPGIQALFGFQLIAVFNNSFSQTLTPPEQKLHLFCTLSLTAIAIALVMTPAAFHRQTGPEKIIGQFIRLATRLLLLSMLPLLVALCIDIYLIARIIAGSPLASVLAVTVGGLFIALWFILPRINNKQQISRE
jgi:Family of unknown function (DUF6328)